jgi:hypothetical protein
LSVVRAAAASMRGEMTRDLAHMGRSATRFAIGNSDRRRKQSGTECARGLRKAHENTRAQRPPFASSYERRRTSLNTQSDRKPAGGGDDEPDHAETGVHRSVFF